jgi:hypothetical protein
MKPRPFWGETVIVDGRAVICLGTETVEEAMARQNKAARRAEGEFGAENMARIERLGRLHKFSPYHFQIIDDEGLALNMWVKGDGRSWSWRVPGNKETERGGLAEMLAVIDALVI